MELQRQRLFDLLELKGQSSQKEETLLETHAHMHTHSHTENPLQKYPKCKEEHV